MARQTPALSLRGKRLLEFLPSSTIVAGKKQNNTTSSTQPPQTNNKKTPKSPKNHPRVLPCFAQGQIFGVAGENVFGEGHLTLAFSMLLNKGVAGCANQVKDVHQQKAEPDPRLGSTGPC